MHTTRQQHMAAKAIRIAAVAKHCADITAKLAPIAFPRKRPRICKRMSARPRVYRRVRVLERAYRRAQLAIGTYISGMQILMILSQPIPKYPQGGVIKDNGEQTEAYIRPGNTNSPKG